nr:MAG TPA: Chromatin remodeling complex ATPase [Caudoviricetes sp.]
MAFKRNMINVWTKIKENKDEKYKSKAAETRAHPARLVDMQRYVDMHPLKRKMLIDVLNSPASDCDLKIYQKGALVFTRLLEVADQLKKDIEDAGFTCYMITSAQNQKQRAKVVEEFKAGPTNKIIIISEAGGESVSLQKTNEIIMYNVPRGPGKWTQTLGRVARMFSKYEGFNVHFITVEDSIDEYSQILLSAKKELEEEILSADTIPLKGEKSFNQMVLKKVRQGLLWRHGKSKKNPKLS